MDPKVVIHQDESGEIAVVFGSGVEVFWVDERQPQDRVFQMSASSDQAVENILSDSPIGSASDQKQKQLITRIEFQEHGLRPVED